MASAQPPIVQRAQRGSVGIDALELFVEILSQSEPGRGSDDFYDRLCEAVCRLARMRRAIIFRYDPASRRVRAAGAHGLELERFESAFVTVESAPLTARALAEDRVLELDGDVREEIPVEYGYLFPEPVRLVCAPMTAARRAIGVILADRLLSEPPLDEAERGLLWSLGKAAALASISWIVSRQSERAAQLEQRIDLAREIHEGVIQRLFGVSMALDGAGPLPAAARERCAAETQAALSELRAALQRPLGRVPRATATTLKAEIERLARQHPELGIALANDSAPDVPRALEPLAQSLLREAVRNARKHARPTHVDVHVRRGDGAFVLEVVNDGVCDRGREREAGMGLRLAALEALQYGGVVEFGEREPGIWQVRLVVEIDDRGA
jgi:signal transduction histidine kinase